MRAAASSAEACVCPRVLTGENAELGTADALRPEPVQFLSHGGKAHAESEVLVVTLSFPWEGSLGPIVGGVRWVF